MLTIRNVATTLLATLAATLTLTISPAAAETPALPLELHEVFASVPDGPAPATLVGTSTPVTNWQVSPGAAPYVRGGHLTTTDPATALGGAYRIAELGADVSYVGTEFVLTPETAEGGVLCLSIQADNIATDAGADVPVSPVHLVVGSRQWYLDVNAEPNTRVENAFSGTFAQPLPTDGETVLRMDLVLDRSTSSLRLSLPDGSVRTLTHPGFALPGRFAYVEPFKTPGPPLAGQSNALVSSWWATTQPVAVVPPVPAVPVTPVVERPSETQAPAPVVVERPGRPTGVRAVRDGRRVEVSWQHADGVTRYAVRCGRAARTTTGDATSVRSWAKRCKVRAFVDGAGLSPWKVVRVRA